MECDSDIMASFSRSTKSESKTRQPRIIEQFVQDVDDFSSQYGSEISVSYTAFNLRGPPSNFPDYGDYPQSFVMRTYGTWWDEAPSGLKNYMPQNENVYTSQDFVEVSFHDAVYPLEVSVFETYNPGALVRIWAFGIQTSKWYLLWEGEPLYAGDSPRVFSPTIKLINDSTKTLKLEFNHKLLPYYTELDAILLKGLKCKSKITRRLMSQDGSKSFEKGQILNKVVSSNLHENIVPPKVVEPENTDNETVLGDFQRLPNETILYMMKYLDIQSLFRCAQVNTHFNRLASDVILYRQIDLRPYWYCVHSDVLATLSKRCKFLQKFDLSWCGSRHKISPTSVTDFLNDSKADLTHLRMNCCKFVDDTVLKAIVNTSTNLQELCLRSVVGCTEWEVLAKLTKLRRVDLYRSDINTKAMLAIISANPGLEHLNVGACKMISSMDDVAKALGNKCPNLISVDFWRSFSLTTTGAKAIGKCKNLQELDVGWCLQVGATGDWLLWLTGTELRKLFLGALRGICDRHIRDILPSLSRLQQLDLLGVRALTSDICDAILDECPDLRLLDVSFCDQIPEAQVIEWREQYPRVVIKRSFQTGNENTPLSELFLAPILE
ncbi:F-box/LRR-repeat protein 4 [Achroia grisella]|uniref:F-box/LRR-repeat protein 4 n=1 Tax=Achroia grisella TaxID=688607 RepID=UPI0027D2B4D6|nr:F-box/LRR-repeat protein 4 [Achroia grisella]